MNGLLFLSPIKIFIVILIVLLIYMTKSETYNCNANWAAGLGYFLVLTSIVLLILVEIVFSFVAKDLATGKKIIISLLLIPTILILLWKTVDWLSTKKNYIYVPKDYKKEYLLIVYNQDDAKFIKPNYGFPRKMKLKFNEQGMLKVKNTRSSIFSPWLEVRRGKWNKYNHTPNSRISMAHRYEIDNYDCGLVFLNMDNNLNIDSVKSEIDPEDVKSFINQEN